MKPYKNIVFLSSKILFSLLFVSSIISFSQTNPFEKYIEHPTFQLSASINSIPLVENDEIGFENITEPLALGEKDSIFCIRGVFDAHLVQKGTKLNKKTIEEYFKKNKVSTVKFHKSLYMRPAGLVLTTGGIALSYIGLKGKEDSRVIDGTKYDFTVRSVPLVLIGITSFVSGLCLIEFSNEFLAKSADDFNSKLKRKKTAFNYRAKFGITPNGNLGLLARF